MDMASLLRPEAVRVVNGLSSKKRLFQDLGQMAASLYGLNADDVVARLQEREGLGPTGVGHGVALPHARLDGPEKVLGVFIRLEKPFNYGAPDKLPVDLIFALLAPQDAGVEHLKALAFVSRTLRDQSTCAKLRANDDPATLHAILTARSQPQAA